MSSVKLYNTATKTYREFKPSGTVKIYVCGITPYDSAHLGHIFTFMHYDLLQRRLEDMGHEVKMVRNITDVDEPIYTKATELGIDYRRLAEEETKSFQAVSSELNFRIPYAEPKASEYIDQMASAVKQMVDDGYGYYVGKDIYFDVSKVNKYGNFSGFDRRLMLKLSNERGGNPELKDKRSPLDFLLWKGIDEPNDPAQWDTTLGAGRPGWHIECTIMASDLLGETFHIHGGGTDLIFPHHESEIVQSIALYSKQPAEIWSHVSPLFLAGEKMSKSLGNMVFAKDLLGHWNASTIRLALMHYDHRKGGEWLPETMEKADQLMKHLKRSILNCSEEAGQKLLEDTRHALDDDLNMTEVIQILDRFVCDNQKPNTSDPKIENAKKAINLLGLRI